MTYKKLLLLGTILAVGLAIIKVFFIAALNLDNKVIFYGFYVVIALFSIALARRIGTIMYIEATFLSVFWTIMSLIVDYIITRPLAPTPIFNKLYFWMTYVVMMLAMFILHKKRHVEIRKEMKAEHHSSH